MMQYIDGEVLKEAHKKYDDKMVRDTFTGHMVASWLRTTSTTHVERTSRITHSILLHICFFSFHVRINRSGFLCFEITHLPKKGSCNFFLFFLFHASSGVRTHVRFAYEDTCDGSIFYISRVRMKFEAATAKACETKYDTFGAATCDSKKRD